MLENTTYIRYFNLLKYLTSLGSRYFAHSDSGAYFEVSKITHDTLQKHLSGSFRLGMFPEVKGGACFGCVDIDCKSSSQVDLKELAYKISDYLSTIGLYPLVEMSKSKRYHVWVFIDTPVSRKVLQDVLRRSVSRITDIKISPGEIEIFPKGEVGNGVYLPYCGMFPDSRNAVKDFHNVFLDVDIPDVAVLSNFNYRVLKDMDKLSQLPPCFTNASLNWVEGTRDAYTCGLAGVAKRHLKLTKEEAQNTILSIAIAKGDESVVERRAVIANTYKKEIYGSCNILQGKDGSITTPVPVCSKECMYYLNVSKKESKKEDKLYAQDYANMLLEEYSRHIYSTSSHIWIYSQSDGCWNSNGEAVLSSYLELGQLLPKARKSTSFINEVLNSVRRQTLDCIHNQFPKTLTHYIPFWDGVWDLQTQEFKPFRPEMYISNKLPWKFNPKASLGALNDVMRGFVSSEDYYMLLELLASTFWRSNKEIQHIWFLKGPGSNGKSLFVDILIHLLGRNNVAALSMDSLHDKFMRQELLGKWLNNGGELNVSDKIVDTKDLKGLSAGDLINVDIKFKDPIKMENTCKLIFSCNRLPITLDTSDGWFRRVIILKFPYKYIRTENSPNIWGSFTVENFEALAYLTLQKLQSIYNKSMRLESAKNPHEMRLVYGKESNPIHEFVEKYCVVDLGDDLAIPKREFKDKLNQWIIQLGIHNPYSDISIKHELSEYYSLEEGRKTFHIVSKGISRREYCWNHISWKVPTDLILVSDITETKVVSMYNQKTIDGYNSITENITI